MKHAVLPLSILLASSAYAADENDYWTIRTLPEPEGGADDGAKLSKTVTHRSRRISVNGTVTNK